MATQGNSDDLIAELAQLIAKERSELNAEDADSLPMETSPEPMDELAQPVSGAPLRGSEIGPTFIRIPGMSEPKPAAEARSSSTPAKAENPARAEPAMSPLPERKVAKTGADAQASEPVESAPAGPAEAPAAPEKAGLDALAFLRVAPAAPASPVENRPDDAAAPADDKVADEPVRQEAVEPEAGPSARTPPLLDDFHFDFGLSADRPAAPTKAEPVPEAGRSRPEPQHDAQPAMPETQARSAETVVGNEHDPIAELIAAELEAAQREEARRARAAEAQEAPTLPAPSRPPLAPGLGPRPAHDTDKFASRPVFGLPARPVSPPPVPRQDLDPMDEIEHLIGAAMRNETQAPAAEARAPAVVPQPGPITRATPIRAASPAPQAERPTERSEPPARRVTPTAPPPGNKFTGPRRAALREVEPEPLSPDEAVLAAMDASGDKVGRPEMPGQAAPPVGRNVRPRRSRKRGGAWLYASAAALVIVLAAGGAGYYMLEMNHPQGPVPVLTADASPVKKPAPPVEPTPSEQTRSQVMAQIDGKPSPKAAEQLVSRDQSAGTDVASIAADNSEGGLANRKVRTVTVRPDGTIVSNPTSVAGNQALPVARPDVPPVPGAAAPTATAAAANPADQIPSTPIELASDQVLGLTDHPSMSDAPSANSPAAASETAQPAPDAAAPGAVDAPVPMPRLADRPTAPIGPIDVASVENTSSPATANAPSSPVNAVVGRQGNALDLMGDGDATQTAAASPAASSPAAPTTTGSTTPMPAPKAGAYVQVASQRSMADATTSMNVVLNRFGNLFPGATPEIVKADLGAKGTYYRVRIPVASFEDASRICSSIKSGGGDCFPTHN